MSSELRRILLPRSRVLSLGYAGGDGGSTLFRHVGVTRTALNVVVYGSSAAVRRPSSLWTSAALSLYGSSGWWWRSSSRSLSLGSHCFLFPVGTRKRLNKHGFLLLGSRQAANVNANWAFGLHWSFALWRLVSTFGWFTYPSVKGGHLNSFGSVISIFRAGWEAFYMEFGGEHKPDSCIVRRLR